MKRFLLILVLVALALPIYSDQMYYVVGEVFTETWCTYCPLARAALRTMGDDPESYPYLIPLIWQGDGVNASPGYSTRRSLYPSNGIPYARWYGTNQIVGGSTTIINNYRSAYNDMAEELSAIDMDIDTTIEGLNVTITADVRLDWDITLNNTRIIFILTHNFDATQQGNYFASVVRYQAQTFNLNSEGDTGSFSQTFTLNSAWDVSTMRAVVFIQNTSGSPFIHQAAMKELVKYKSPFLANITSFSSEAQTHITWQRPPVLDDISGYLVYRDGQPLFSQPIIETAFTDMVLPNDTYVYTIKTVYADGVITDGTNYSATNDNGYVQLGGGTLVNGTTFAGPINVYYQSRRGQFIYTKEEMNQAGVYGAQEFNSFGFYVQQRPFYSLPSFTIRLANTTRNNVLSNISYTPESVTVISSYTPTAGRWDMIRLAEPFLWDGESNILIDTAFGLVPNYNSSGTVRIVLAPNSYRIAQHDDYSMINTTPNSLVDFKPQVRFDYTPEFVLYSPQDLRATQSEIANELIWSAPFTDHPAVGTFEGYQVYRNNFSISEVITVTSFIDKDIQPSQTYQYFVIAIYNEGESIPSNTVSLAPFVSDEDKTAEMTPFRLIGNYPNPFNPSTTIEFGIRNAELGMQNVNIDIYNIKGQKVRSLVNSAYPAGTHKVVWNGKDDSGHSVGSGIYFYRMKTSDYTTTKKMILMK